MPLHITDGQMRQLGQGMRRSFETDALAMLRQRFPESTASHPDGTLRLFVRHGIERARVHGLVTVAEVQRWLALMMRLGAYFDAGEQRELAPVREALAHLEVYGALRLDAAELAADAVTPAPR